MTRSRPSWLAPLLVAVVLAAAALWLRWPTFSFRVWNVDEAIHAAVAETLNAGGVMYRDAIDQRTPLTYYAVALLFRVAGHNNIWALHAATALLIAATAFLLYLAGRRLERPATGAWAGGLYVLFATGLLWPGDAFAFNTEWAVAFFASAAALVWLASPAPPGAGRLFGIGFLFGLSYLSKQPGLLDLAAPAAALAYTAWLEPATRRGFGRRALALLAGCAVPVAATFGYFWAHHALADLHFYTWTYNLRYYGPEIPADDRLLSVGVPFRLFAEKFPVLGLFGAAASGYLVWRLAQRAVTASERRDNPTLCLLVVWAAASLAGGASGGRGFDHYFIPFLAPFSLICGWALAGLGAYAADRGNRLPLRLLLGIGLGAVALAAILTTLAARGRTQATDPSQRAAQFVGTLTAREDRIFVWGYHPDAYLFADRRPASRFVYGSFVTGLIPWTNVAPDRDTTYAAVPGSLDTLLRDLATHRPAAIIDCSSGPNRFWNKYPLSRFPRLAEFVDRHYVLANAGEFLPQGFGVYLLLDSARAVKRPLAGGSEPAGLEAPQIFGPAHAELKPTAYTIRGSSRTARLQRLELLRDGELVDGVSFAPVATVEAAFTLPFDRLGEGTHRLTVRATAANGETVTGRELVVQVERFALSAEQRAEFALPRLANAVIPSSVRAVYGASVEHEGGQTYFYAHAPSVLVYPLPAGARTLRGGFGFRPGAYADGNPTPTDGADFSVVLRRPDGALVPLYHRLLQPLRVEGDRGTQSLEVKLPASAAGALEFVISPGPADNAACDWTYWTNLTFETSR